MPVTLTMTFDCECCLARKQISTRLRRPFATSHAQHIPEGWQWAEGCVVCPSCVEEGRTPADRPPGPPTAGHRADAFEEAAQDLEEH